ncbi:MAG: DUF418 domain-containing protein [Phenylobacterium sp.]|uniref:DUF418 domain-containing protein n=2 Tax=Phenylobacterium sp. TaxID=1871053 RepID=UPI0025EF1D71|nr:DUF418 domain-containing protein [Phenylobacterium sp.]MCA6232730.1 DUF418 domain-containing protein [Phenylobacterium sp.]MCA6235995.1 DUF418 domain-containing protein [Phenylobacterium sp.]MCA6250620.1 DUF418 domain-containing protein [Phenylobacterium sp.]MCA6252795.1 DUF418 domain-containing protein [Phenylobacterium sp.]MCA6266603.1 DUF418 domain-containing protein [Phenylobacterium sp.]
MTSESPGTGERILSIDVVRGMAVLGILLMNIVAMGLPTYAYLNPVYGGGTTGADFWTWAVNNVLADGKMRALFTMLFGASMVLIASRAEAGSGLGPVQTHYRRLFWMFVIGMIHAYFFFLGDILVTYALAGALIFPLRKLSPRLLVALGAGVLAALFAWHLYDVGQARALMAAATAPGASEALRAAWAEASQTYVMPPGFADQEIALFRGDFMDALEARARIASLLQVLIPFDAGPEAVGQMLLGMGLFRLGFFSLGWSTRAYLAVMVLGYAAAVPFTASMTWLIHQSGFEPVRLHELEVWQSITRPFIALAHASVLLLIVRAGLFRSLVSRLEAAGRMAFTNYLMTSVITSLVFCGYGLGLYGHLSRAEQLWVVAGVWALILLWSRPWLARFRYGPLEWIWRSLVQWKRQPFRKATA